MISLHVSEPSAPASLRSMRRGGPFLFKTIWPDVRDQLAEVVGLDPRGRATPAPSGFEPPEPPYSRAA